MSSRGAARIRGRPAVGADHRDAARVADDVALAGLDILIADAGGEGERRADRHDHVAADIDALEALVEAAARILAGIAGADRPAERQPARRHADAGGGAVRGRAVEIVVERAAGAVVVDLDVAEPVGGVDRERAGMGRQGRADIGAVDVDRCVAVGDAEHAPFPAGAGGERAGVEREHAGDDLGVDHGDAAR